VPSVKAGKVSFAVRNTGATMHGFGIAQAPAKVSGGMLDDSTLLAKGKELRGGQSDTVTATLKPGATSWSASCRATTRPASTSPSP
jgi:hypothetical protein